MNDRMQGFWSTSFSRLRDLPKPCAVFVCVVLTLTTASAQTAPGRQPSSPKLDDILSYIHAGWDSLTRSTTSCNGISDPKLSGPPLLYLPARFSEPAAVKQMQQDCGVKVEPLPP